MTIVIYSFRRYMVLIPSHYGTWNGMVSIYPTMYSYSALLFISNSTSKRPSQFVLSVLK